MSPRQSTNVAKDAPYDKNPELDEDIKHTIKHGAIDFGTKKPVEVVPGAKEPSPVPNVEEDLKSAPDTPAEKAAKGGKEAAKETAPTSEAELQLESDPIGASIGIVQYLHPKEEKHPVDYFVPDFGNDPDMDATANSIKIAEQAHSHKLIMGTPESKAKWHNLAKETMYNFAPELDEDIVTSQANEARASALAD